MTKTKEEYPIFDARSMISRRYFSNSGRNNHTFDIYHDKDNIFPPFNGYEKPSCRDGYQCRVKDIAQKLTPNTEQTPKNGLNNSYLPAIEKFYPNELFAPYSNALSEVKQEKKIEFKSEEKKLIVPDSPMIKAFKVNKFSGQEMLERSRDLVNSMKSPKEIFTEAFELKGTKNSVLRSRKYGKEQLRTLARKLDITVNLEDDGEYQKAGSFLRKIPAEYYKKLRTLTQKSPRRSSSSNTGRIAVPRINIRVDDDSLLSRDPPSDIPTPSPLPKASTPNKSFDYARIKRPNRTRRIRQGSLAADITNREKNLFLSSMEDYLKSRRGTVLEDYSGFFITNDVRREEKGYGIMKIENEKGDKNDWIQRTNQLTQEINEFISRPGNSLNFVDSVQEKIHNDIKKLKVDRIERADSSYQSEVDLGKEDIEQVLQGANERTTKNAAYSRFNTRLSVSTKGGYSDSGSFYKNLMAKEQRSAEKSILNATYFKPRVQKKKIGGRDLFNPSNKK